MEQNAIPAVIEAGTIKATRIEADTIEARVLTLKAADGKRKVAVTFEMIEHINNNLAKEGK